MNRVDETQKVKSILNSDNHLIIISPRRYGKTSLINKVAKSLHRPFIILDLQLITTQSDFASQLLKLIYRIYPLLKLKDLVKNFRITPSITLNPATNEIDIEFILPVEYTLEQNYPNPFNPSTIIKYQVSSISQVLLKVYDLLGKEVAVLVNEEKPAGKYEVEFQSTIGSRLLASGVYYYQLRVGEYLETKKMLMLK